MIIEEAVRNQALLWGFAVAAAAILAHRRARWWWVALLVAWAAFEGVKLVEALWSEPQLDAGNISFVRAVVAALAALALLREGLAPPRFPAHRAVLLGVLGVSGIVGVACFYNLGHEQFWHDRAQARTYIHFLDHRQYYMTAKYFEEIGYRGIYRADIAAYLETTRSARELIENLPMRDLDTHGMSTVKEQWAEIDAIKQRFSAERWLSYKNDARYFREAMGQQMYFRYMIDYGGNATPVWIAMASALYNLAPASDGVLLLTALLDPLLLLLVFAAIWWCYGVRTMLVSMTVFGANDFIMYGTNWSGATLRHDWLAYIALGACALKRGQWMLGGALLALSAMIRAFPALAVAALVLPALWGVWTHWVLERRLPSLAEFRRENRALERAWLGAAAVVVVCFLGTASLYSFEAWSDWWRKVSLLAGEPHGNHISLRSLIGGFGGDQLAIVHERLLLYWSAQVAFVVMVAAACRGKRPDQAAIFGMILMPVFFYPANYYIHFIFLLPLLMTETRERVADLWVPVPILLLCVAQYFTVPVVPTGQRFYLATVLLFCALTALLVGVLRGDVRAGRWKSVVQWLEVR